ncbi:MAG: nucleotidyltransferase family protein [Paludibacteraceae bacterium]|nr:nucleotidyltransferase family protein [Paludibacteraceae bacterium]
MVTQLCITQLCVIFICTYQKKVVPLQRERKKRMKSTQEYISTLKQHAPILRDRFGMTAMSLFGSVARGEQNENSDVDVLVDMPPTLRAVGGANDYLEQILGCHVDMIRNHNRLTPFFRKQVARDGITIF